MQQLTDKKNADFEQRPCELPLSMLAALLLYCGAILLTDASWLYASSSQTWAILFRRGDILAPALLAAFFVLARTSLKRVQTYSGADVFVCILLALLFLLGRLLIWAPENNCLARIVNAPIPSLIAVAAGALFLLLLLQWGRYAVAYLAKKPWKWVDVFLRRPVLNTFLLLLLCWAPYIIIRWPGSIEYDTYQQIRQINGMSELTGGSPPMTAFLIGGCVKLGKMLFDNWDVGLAGYTLLQSGACALILAYAVAVMKRLGAPKFWCVASALIFGICPAFPAILTTVVKDAPFAASMMLCVVLLAEYLLDQECVNTRKLLGIGVASTLMCTFRNGGACYVAVTAVAVAVFFVRRRERPVQRLLLYLAGGLALYGVYCVVLFGVLEIPADAKSSAASTMSIPFQQTARFVKYYPEDVTKEEAQAIAAVLDYERLGELYKPEISDPVKGTYHGDAEDLRLYYKVWFKQFLRRPACYVQATLLGCLPYFYPYEGLTYLSLGKSCNGPIYFSAHPYMYGHDERLFDYVANSNASLWAQPFCSIGLQTWVLLYLLTQGWKRKKNRFLLLLFPSLTCVVMCMGSPAYLNGNAMRYATPILLTSPFLAGVWLGQNSIPDKINKRIDESADLF